ncbi:MAG: succinate dehydrogenase, hydrophobic membrane anchor protein [Pseudomonadota bacterium]|nr:succinate dehydrogenase, hydrophobic membrane anchor protein [Pseudomonadota bacterium]
MADTGKGAEVDIRRSQLGRVRGLGAAHAGSGHWWAQRVTSLALAPLALWFIASVIRLEGANRADMVAWLHEPVPLVLVLCLIVAMFWHMDLGLRVVIEDYVHREPAHLALLLIQRGMCVVAAIFCLVAALRLGL